MTPTKEEVTQETIKALKQFIRKGDMSIFSCIFVQRHLLEAFKNRVDYVKYRLTEQVLASSEDAHLYSKVCEEAGIYVSDPFCKARDVPLRKRFVKLAIKNLESKKFDLSIEMYTESDKDVNMFVHLVLNPECKKK